MIDVNSDTGIEWLKLKEYPYNKYYNTVKVA